MAKLKMVVIRLTAICDCTQQEQLNVSARIDPALFNGDGKEYALTMMLKHLTIAYFKALEEHDATQGEKIQRTPDHSPGARRPPGESPLQAGDPKRDIL
jgi:hypothetical protein